MSLFMLPYSISELFAKVSKSGKINVLEYYRLMAALPATSLNEEDYRSIKRLLHAVRRGWVQVVGLDPLMEN